jgi:antitoxin component YwqK of YwqJK toxin-antitoxin module
MKKLTIVLSLFILAFLFSGCSSSRVSNEGLKVYEYGEYSKTFLDDNTVVIKDKSGKNMEGKVKLISESGVYSISNLKNGRFQGTDMEYYKSGKLKAEAPFKNGKFHGVLKEYNESGTMQYEMLYKEGMAMNGYHWDSSGKKIKYTSDEIFNMNN